LIPQFEYESQGLEDPRITRIEDVFYLTYTAYDGINALGALAISKDLQTFSKVGLIVPQIQCEAFMLLAESKTPLHEKYHRYNKHSAINEEYKGKVLLWDKNVIFFPRKIHGKLVFLHRIRPDIQIVSFENISDLTPQFWQNYLLRLQDHILLSPLHNHEVSYVGGGCVPIETAAGWLLIYHGVCDSIDGYVYSACAALLDLKNPEKLIARLPYPLFKPELDWELKGEVNNVCFPTGAIVVEGILYIYYGAADERIGVASVNLMQLLNELLLYTQK
jgi:predicted GH43/DUF377 family glycosyl hydrolase